MIIRISIIGFFLLLLMNSIHYYKSGSKSDDLVAIASLSLRNWFLLGF